MKMYKQNSKKLSGMFSISISRINIILFVALSISTSQKGQTVHLLEIDLASMLVYGSWENPYLETYRKQQTEVPRYW